MGSRGSGEFILEGPDDSWGPALLNDFCKLRAVIGHEADAFYKDVINAPAGRKPCHAIDNGDGLVVGGKRDATGNFAAV